MLSRVRTTLVALTTVLTAVLTVSLGVSSTADAATSAKPKVGQCHQLSWAQTGAIADPKKAVSCGKRHNLTTVAVVTSPTGLEGLTDEQHGDLGTRLCRPALRKALGRSAVKRAQTAYGLIFFSPTPAQIAAGARWIRCDVGLFAGNRLKGLPKHLHRPIVQRRITDDVRRCLTRSAVTTTCDRAHAFRSVKAFTVDVPTRPSSDRLLALADRRCERGWDYASWPGEQSWAAGEHAVTCFDRTKK